MRIGGTIEEVVAHGYERILAVRRTEDGRTYWLSTFEPEHDVSTGAACPVWRKGQQVELSLMLRYVTKFQPVPCDSSVGLKQPINGSAHCEVVAEVVALLETDYFDCDIGYAGATIKVDCEAKHNLVVGQIVAFTAELARKA